MGLAFPTRTGPPSGSPAGEPVRAASCRCVGGPLLEREMCIRCGRYPREIVSATWHRRAQTVAAVGQREKQCRLAA